MGKLDGKVALITGGSEGIGFGVVERFVAEGVEHVFLTSISQQSIDQALQRINKDNVTGIQGDVSKLDDYDRLIKIIKEKKGRLDIVFANAGILVDGLIGSINENDFDEVFNINVKGILFTVQKSLELLVNGGTIILNSSVRSSKGSKNRSLYSGTKASIRSFARSWAIELKDRNIRVNAISPGAIDISRFKTKDLNEQKKSIVLGDIASLTPMNRRGTTDEVANAVLFLASDQSSFITGTELFVDGGFAQV